MHIKIIQNIKTYIFLKIQLNHNSNHHMKHVNTANIKSFQWYSFR
jgi:hypothetical protein